MKINQISKKIILMVFVVLCISVSFTFLSNNISTQTTDTEQTVQAATTITTVSGLKDISGYGEYELGGDIDLSGKIWTPISNFKGTLDGKGYEITGLTIDTSISSSGGVGLFSETSATLKNIILRNVNIVSSGTAGALAGTASGTITGCASFGSISGNSSYTGGLVGSYSGTMTNCYSYANTNGGALVGRGGSISRSFFAGKSSSALSGTNCYDYYKSSGSSMIDSDWLTNNTTYGNQVYPGANRVLKGVGNIFVEIAESKFDGKTYLTATTKTSKLVKFTHFSDSGSSSGASYTTDPNYTITKYEAKNVITGEESSSKECGNFSCKPKEDEVTISYSPSVGSGQGYYKMTVYVRGKLINVTSGVKTYAGVLKSSSSWELSTHVKVSNVKCTDASGYESSTYYNEYKDVPTTDFKGKSYDYWIPYGESCTVTFQDNHNGNYLSEVYSGRYGANSESCSSSLNYSWASGYTTTMSINSNLKMTTSGGVTSTTYYHYFNNIFDVTISQKNQIDGTTPSNTNWDSNYTNSSKKINVMLYESICSKGFVYNDVFYGPDNKGKLVVTNGNPIFPIWSKFRCSAISDGSTSWFTASKSDYGAELTASSSIWTCSSTSWYPVWKSVEQSTSIVKSYISKVSYNYSTSSTISTNTLSARNVSFSVTPQKGYELDYIDVDTPGGTNTITLNGTYTYKSFDYFGCDLAENNGNTSLKVSNSCTISYSSGIYTVTFSNLVGVDQLKFFGKETKYYLDIRTNFNSSITESPYSSKPMSVNGVEINKDTGYKKGYISLAQGNSLTLSYSVKTGYEIVGTITTPSGFEVSKTFNETAKTITLTLTDPGTYTGGDNNYVPITINLKRKSTTFKFVVSGNIDLSQDKKTGNFFGINYKIDNGSETTLVSPSKQNIITVDDKITTDTVLYLVFKNLPYNIQMSASNVTVSGLNNSYYKINKTSSTQSNQKIEISKLLVDTSGIVEVDIEFTVENANLTVIKNVNGDQIRQDKIQIPYGSKVVVSRATGKSYVSVNAYTLSTNSLINLTYSIDDTDREIVISYGGVKSSVLRVDNANSFNYELWVDVNDNNIVLDYEQKGMDVIVAETYIANKSTIIGNLKNSTSEHKYIQNYGEISGDVQTGYKLIGYYYVLKETSGTPVSDNFTVAGKFESVEDSPTFKYVLGAQKDGYTTIAIEEKVLYIVKVYEARVFTAKFVTTIYDDNQGRELAVTLDNTSRIDLEYAKNYECQTLPIATIDGMFDFTGWKSGTKQVTYSNQYTGKFNLQDCKFEGDYVVFNIQSQAKKVKITYLYNRDINSKILASNSNTTYGKSSYTLPNDPTRLGFKFVGWKYLYNKDTDFEIAKDYNKNASRDGTTYIASNNGVKTYKVYDIESTSVYFYAEWETIDVEITFTAGGLSDSKGEFPDGATEHKGYFRFNTTNFKFSDGFSFENANWTPTWENKFGVFEFECFILNSDPTKKYYPQSDEFTYEVSEEDLAKYVNDGYKFVAYYKLVALKDVKTSQLNEWVYNGTITKIELTFEKNNAISYSYAWYYNDEQIEQTNPTNYYNVKNVVDSGKYHCVVTANFNNKTVAYGEVTKESQASIISITPKQLKFTQSGKATSTLTKMYDNTNQTDTTVSFTGVCSGDSISMTAIYLSIDVGKDIEMQSSISATSSSTDVRNYTKDDDIKGVITPYKIQLKLKDSKQNYIVEVGPKTKQNKITEYYEMTDSVIEFMQKNLFSATYILKTSQNVGSDENGGKLYKQNNGDFSIINTYDVKNGVNTNFEIDVLDNFYIKLTDPNSVGIYIAVYSNDEGKKQAVDSTIATLTFDVDRYKDQGHEYNIDGNNTSAITIFDLKTMLALYPDLSVSLNILKSKEEYGNLFWLDYWEITIDNVVIANEFTTDDIIYTITNSQVSQIEIACFVTSLAKISFNYDLAKGEEIEEKTQETKFQIAQTVQHSIDNYSAVLPSPKRTGFTFDGWYLGTTKITEQSVWDKNSRNAPVELIAYWTFDSINIANPIVNVNFTYDGLEHTAKVDIQNRNDLAIDYWTESTYISTADMEAKIKEDTLTVKDCVNNGVYTYTINATYNGKKQTATWQVIVKIEKFDLLPTVRAFTKIYDKSFDYEYAIVDSVGNTVAPNGEIVVLKGRFTTNQVGGTLLKSSIGYYVKVDNEIKDYYVNNYNLDVDKIDYQNSTINKKDVELTFTNQIRQYNTQPIIVESEFKEDLIEFTYAISSNSANVGKYSQKLDNLKIEIEGDNKSNFNFTLIGTMEITKRQLKESDAYWYKDTSVEFDGKSHSVAVKVRVSEDDPTSGLLDDNYLLPETNYSYYKGGEKLSALPVLAGEYRVEAKFDTEFYYGTLTMQMVILQRVLYVTDVGTEKINKIYDGTNVVNQTLDQFKIERIVEGFEPSFAYTYESVLAGEDIPVEFILDSANTNSANYTLSFPKGKIVGDIYRKSITIQVTAQKQYDGEKYFTVTPENIVVNGAISGELIAGNIKFAVTDVDLYVNPSIKDSQIENNLTINNLLYSTNYKVDSLSYSLDIIKAKMNFYAEVADSYDYCGSCIEFTKIVTKIETGSFDYEHIIKISFTNRNDSTDKSNTAVKVGAYTVTFTVDDQYSRNFEIVEGQTVFDFTIVQRKLLFAFTKTFPYNNKTRVYQGENNGAELFPANPVVDDEKKVLYYNTLGDGDIISWNFETTGKNVGSYYLMTTDDVVIHNLKIYKDGVDYTDNYYLMYGAEAIIKIEKITVDRKDVILTSKNPDEYTAKEKQLVFTVNYDGADVEEPYIITTLLRDGDNVTKILYAGKYSVTIELQNYDISNNKPFTYEITKKLVDIDIFTIQKMYDGTTYVAETCYQMKEGYDFIQADKDIEDDDIKPKVVGEYSQKDVGNPLAVKFYVYSSSLELQNSYELKTTEGVGRIDVNQKTLELIDGNYDTYYDGEFVKIAIEYFTVEGSSIKTQTLEKEETLREYITLPKKDYIEGGYDLSVLSDKIDISALYLTNGGDLANYKLYFKGIVNLKQAVIEMNVKDLETIYNADYQEPIYEKLIYKDQGKITEDEIYSIEYSQNGKVLESLPKDAGVYTIKLTMFANNENGLSNYIFVIKNISGVFEYDTDGNVKENTTITYNNAFSIAKRQIAISVQGRGGNSYVSKTYVEGQNATYKVLNTDLVDPSTDNNNGLLSDVHTLNCVLSTNSDVGDKIYTADFKNATMEQMQLNTNELFILSYEIIENGSLDVSKNYELVYVKGQIKIVFTSDRFDTDALDELVYNGEDKVKNGEFFVKFMIQKNVYTFTLNGANTYSGNKGRNVITNLQYEGKSTTEIVLAGTYTVDLYIKPPAEEMNEISETITFTVKPKDITDVAFISTKEYDGTSTVLGTFATNQICSRNGVVDNVTFVGTYTSNGADVKTVGTNYKIKITSTGADAKNYTVSKLYDGEITKRAITLTLNSDRHTPLIYTNNTQDIPYSEFDITSGSLASGENLDGFVTVLQLDIGTYIFESKDNSNIEKLKILLSEENVISNYAITISGSYTINPLTINIIVEANIMRTYTGRDLSIEGELSIDNTDEKINEAVKTYRIIEYYNSKNEKVSSDTDKTKTGVIDAGSYSAKIYSSSQNIEFVVKKENGNILTNNTINFSVSKCSLDIFIEETKKYNPTSDHETTFSWTVEDVPNIAEGQELRGTYRLYETGLGVGSYTYDKKRVKFENIRIFDSLNPTDTTILDRNYTYDIYATIKIEKYEINEDNARLVQDKLVYDSTDAILRLEFTFVDANGVYQTISKSNTTWGTIELVEDTAINVKDTPYRARVFVNNCILTGGNSDDGSKDYEFTIIPKEITEIEFTSSKVYDGTSDVLNVSPKAGQILGSDVVELVGTYINKDDSTQQINVGKHSIMFAIKNRNIEPAKNYAISSEIQESGEITKRQITFKITKQFVFQSIGEYAIPYSSDLISSGTIVSGQTLSGELKLLKSDYVGSVNISEIDITGFTVHDSDDTDTTQNYEFILASDSEIQIDKAILVIDFIGLESSYTYSANAQNIDLTGRIKLTNSTEDVLPELTHTYKNSNGKVVEPKNIGTYSLELSPKSNCYEIQGESTFNFEITKYNWLIEKVQNPPSKYYNADEPDLLCVEISPLDEQVTLHFERISGESIGKYDMTLISWDNENYVITLSSDAGKGLFVIKKADTLTVVVKDTQNNRLALQKEYNTKETNAVDIKLLEVEDKNASKYASTSYLDELEGEIYFTNGANVGEYSYSNKNGLKSVYYENIIVECELKFAVTPKDITYSVQSTEKAYDGTTEFVETIDILDKDGNILDKNTYSLIAKGEYLTKDVGTNIQINVILSGDELTNYNPQTTLTGSIIARKVQIMPKDNQSRIYGEEIGEIEYDVVDAIDYKNAFSGERKNELIAGKNGGLHITYIQGNTNFIVGSYDILCDFTSTNFELSFVSKIFEITKKELFITDANNFTKDYDGTPIVNNEGFIYDGFVYGDNLKTKAYYYSESGDLDSSVGINKIVKFEPLDNYYVGETTGSIGEKGIKLVYKYDFDDMRNSSLIKDNSITSQSLTYGAKVSVKVDTMPQPKHEGYTFQGWYLDNTYTTEINLDTYIDESIWEITLQEKTAYAKWTINTYTLVAKVATEIDNIYTESTLGGTINETYQNTFDYADTVDLTALLSPNASTGYNFVCFSSDINLIEDYSNGYIVKANTSGENVVYVKFVPQKVRITLDANGGIFEKGTTWTYNPELTVAYVEVKFGTTLSSKGIDLPNLSRTGYTLSTNGWGSQSGKNTADIDFTVNTILSDDYLGGKTLYAVWENDDFVLTLNANGGYFDNFDTDIWHASAWDDNGRATVVSKVIYFDSLLGDLIYPTKDGWTFTNYSNQISENYFFNSLGNLEADATYRENDYKLQINALHHNIDVEIMDKDGNLLDKKTFTSGDTMNIDVKTTNQCKITAINTQGYEFNSWTSTYSLVDGNTDNIIVIEQFLKNETLTANYNCKQNTITIKVNDISKGYIQVDGISQEGKGEIEIYAPTESKVQFVAIPYEGYVVSSWKCDAGNFGYELTGEDASLERILSNFISDVVIELLFEPRENQITVIANEEKGLISTQDGTVSGAVEHTFSVKTEDTFTFIITAKHGYILSENQNDWNFNTTSANKGDITFELNETKDVCTVTFTNFVSDGEIVVPFVIKQFSVKFVLVLENDKQFTQTSTQDLVNISYAGNTTSVDSNGTYTQTYKEIVKVVQKQDVRDGYTFVCWSKSPNSEYDITNLEGLENVYSDNSIDLRIQDDMTIYLIYAINEYRISYVIDNIAEGGISTSNNVKNVAQKSFDIYVRYGYNADEVVAITSEYFDFDRWVKVEDDGTYSELTSQDYELNGTGLVVKNVKQDANFKALFTGKPITINISLIVPKEQVFSNLTDFGKLTILENGIDGIVASSGVVSQTDKGTMITYTVSSYAGKQITAKLTEENGYLFSFTSPAFSYDSNTKIITISDTTYVDTDVEVFLKAQENKVIVKIIGDNDGGTLYPDYTGITGIAKSIDEKETSLEFTIYSGGSISATMNIKPGFKMLANNYFGTPSQVANSRYTTSSVKIENINQDMTIEVELQAYIYKVTFDFNYNDDGQTQSSVVTTVKANRNNFSPTLGSDVINPTRNAKWKFVGWSTRADNNTDLIYYFENSKIYYYSENAQKTFGFAGSDYVTSSQETGVDYECTLYAIWELVTYKVNVILVPSVATSRLIYLDIFPNDIGRKILFDQSGNILGIEYEPGETVRVVAPIGNKGYTYCGWSYESNIIRQSLLNTDIFEIQMPENSVTVYLYYIVDVEIKTVGGKGTVTLSKQQVMPGESVTVSATPEDGYLFSKWLLNGTEVSNSKDQMSIKIEKASTITCEFVGKEIEVITQNADRGTLQIESKTQYTEGVFRVGDTVTFSVTNIEYGYMHSGWTGEYSGKVNGNTYTLTKEDATRGYVIFKPVVSPIDIVIEFVVSDINSGYFEIQGTRVNNNFRKIYKYDSVISYGITVEQRYVLTALSINGKTLAIDCREIKIHADDEYKFDINGVNKIEVTIEQLLWIDAWSMFDGNGTKENPYEIYKIEQLAAMAYLINNNIEAQGTTPYAKGYYRLKIDANLVDKFWVPIGTKENPFDGTFDFVDNDVTNLYTDKYYEVTNCDGLFGYITENAKFIRNKADYTLTIILISSLIGLIVLIIIILLLWKNRKKKKIDEMSNVYSVTKDPNFIDSVNAEETVVDNTLDDYSSTLQKENYIKKTKPQRKRRM